MTDIIAISICLVLTLVALVHLYWALGGFWPGHDEKSLVKAVIGTNGLEEMPSSALTILVAILISTAGIAPLVHIGMINVALPDWTIQSAVITLAAIFLLRGAATYTPFASSMQFEEPFNRLNQMYYSPLCLVLGMGFAGMILLV